MDKNNNLKDYNPLTRMDYPDPDVIRVDDTYYMISTTMHFMPGGVILRSYDLMHWEIATYVYDELDNTPGQCLEDGVGVYGKGMWAASLRYYQGTFYVCFVCNDTQKTYLYTATDINGPWKKQNVEGFYHDCSLHFEEDGSVFIVYGNTDIHLTQLKEDLSGPKPGGIDRIIVRDIDNPNLGYEGAHLYKIHGKYYVFFIHSRKDRWMRTEACFMADSLEGEFTGKDVFEDDRDYCGSGVAQGAIVDTPDGDWYAILFQDSGAIGRMLILLPVHFEGDWPVFGVDGKVPVAYEVKSTRPDYIYAPLYGNDFMKKDGAKETGIRRLADYWQFNHTPVDGLWDITEDCFSIQTGKLCDDLVKAQNTLTQRMVFPQCEAEVTLDFSELKEGDIAGLCAFQSCYGFVGVTIEDGKPQLIMASVESNEADMFKLMDKDATCTVCEKIPLTGSQVRLKLEADFWKMKDTVHFYYQDTTTEGQSDTFIPIGKDHRVFFKLDHFCGCRAGLFAFSTKEAGGKAVFSRFNIR